MVVLMPLVALLMLSSQSQMSFELLNWTTQYCCAYPQYWSFGIPPPVAVLLELVLSLAHRW
jgi:hypothetical protein